MKKRMGMRTFGIFYISLCVRRRGKYVTKEHSVTTYKTEKLQSKLHSSDTLVRFNCMLKSVCAFLDDFHSVRNISHSMDNWEYSPICGIRVNVVLRCYVNGENEGKVSFNQQFYADSTAS